MRLAMNTGELRSRKTDLEVVPFINLSQSDPSAIFSALNFAAKECKKQHQRSCFVTFDQPLYAKATEIVAASSIMNSESVIIRLSGFHLLMSFLGTIGYLIAGSGLEELHGLVYAPTSVVHMHNGHAYSAFTIRRTLADLVFLRDRKLVPLCRLLPHLLLWVLL